MKRGHVTGTRRHRPQDSTWYAAIEAATLAELERTWHDTVTTQEVAQTDDATARPQRAYSTSQDNHHSEHSEE